MKNYKEESRSGTIFQKVKPDQEILFRVRVNQLIVIHCYQVILTRKGKGCSFQIKDLISYRKDLVEILDIQ